VIPGIRRKTYVQKKSRFANRGDDRVLRVSVRPGEGWHRGLRASIRRQTAIADCMWRMEYESVWHRPALSQQILSVRTFRRSCGRVRNQPARGHFVTRIRLFVRKRGCADSSKTHDLTFIRDPQRAHIRRFMGDIDFNRPKDTYERAWRACVPGFFLRRWACHSWPRPSVSARKSRLSSVDSIRQPPVRVAGPRA